MKFGIITLVSDNYGNKYQNYAVEQLLSRYGEVETFQLEGLYKKPKSAEASIIKKMSPTYIREVMISRLMYKYDITCIDKGVLHNYLYAKRHVKELLELKKLRSARFEQFSKENLHISETVLNYSNTTQDWTSQFDVFICGSDQIWNPTYATTSALAFCSFAPEKTVCLSPSFGVSEIPEFRKEEYTQWLKEIKILSVREDAGKKIVKELTGRTCEVFLDPTMLIPVEVWKTLCRRPQIKLPERYIVCYFLGRITKDYKSKIEKIAKDKEIPVVMLFDILNPEYYILDPAEVLYVISHADLVMTDSFHGTVFSILFHKNFYVFDRNEGGSKMNSRVETLLNKFKMMDRMYKNATENDIYADRWIGVDVVLETEKKRINQYIRDALV